MTPKIGNAVQSRSGGNMNTSWKNRGFVYWLLQIPGWLLLIYLIYAQGISAFGYELGVLMGTQEPIEVVTEVGAAFWYGFALGDLLVYCTSSKHLGQMSVHIKRHFPEALPA